MATNQTFVDYQTPIPADWLNNVNNKVNILANKGTNIASAAAINLGAATGDYVVITGTTTITSLGTADAGTERTLVFSGVLTLAHNATSLILPGGSNIVTDVGDIATFRSEGSGNWRCTGYQPNINGLKSDLPLSFNVGGSERMRIDTSGNVGIGANGASAVPSASLHVRNSTNALIKSEGASGYGGFYAMGSGTNASYIFLGNVTNGEKARLTDDGTSDALYVATGNAATPRLYIGSAGTLHLDPTSSLGYGYGAGGTVTQSTSKSTAVTLNKPCGQITMNNAALAAGVEVFFNVNNTLVTESDLVLISPLWAAVNPFNYQCRITYVGAYTLGIAVKNISAWSLSEALVINFAIIKGSAS